MSNTSFLLDNYLRLPQGSAEAYQAFLELQYSVAQPSKTSPAGIVKLYHTDRDFVYVPRHYLDLSTIDYQYVGPWDFPLLEGKCSIEPWGNTQETQEMQADAMHFLRQLGPDPAASDSIVSLRCGGGKTYIGIRGFFDYGHHTLVVAHTKDILNNWYDDIRKTTQGVQVGSIISGSYDLQPITLSLIQSLIALPPERKRELQQRFGCTVIDEMHHLSAEKFSQIANLMPGRRIGLSATMAREDGLSWVYFSSMGKRIFSRAVVRKKAPVTFKKIPVRDVDFLDNYARSVSVLSESEQYVSALEAEIRRGYHNQEKQLVVGNRKELLRTLYTRLQDLDPGLNIGDTPDDIRHNNLRTKPIILGIELLAKEGLNEPSLTTLRVVTPVKDRNAIVQMIGRLERNEDEMTIEAVFYVPMFSPFLRTMERAKESLAREGYYFREVMHG